MFLVMRGLHPAVKLPGICEASGKLQPCSLQLQSEGSDFLLKRGWGFFFFFLIA